MGVEPCSRSHPNKQPSSLSKRGSRVKSQSKVPNMVLFRGIDTLRQAAIIACRFNIHLGAILQERLPSRPERAGQCKRSCQHRLRKVKITSHHEFQSKLNMFPPFFPLLLSPIMPGPCAKRLASSHLQFFCL